MSARHVATGPLTREERLAGLDTLLRVSAELVTEVRRDLHELQAAAAQAAAEATTQDAQ